MCGYSQVAINHRDKHWIFALGKWLVPAEMSVCSPPATYLCLQHNLPMPLGEDTQKHRHIGTDNLEHPGTKFSGWMMICKDALLDQGEVHEVGCYILICDSLYNYFTYIHCDVV